MCTTLVCDSGQVETQIDKCVDNTVADLVEEELNKYIPKRVREDVDRQRMEIHQLHVEIHNALSIPHVHT